jgi:hypothetical protein
VSSVYRQKNHEEKYYRLALSAMLFALCGSVGAQQTGKVARIGFIQALLPCAVLWEQADGLGKEYHRPDWRGKMAICRLARWLI